MTRMKTHTPISAIAVSNTLLLGVRYNFALQLKSRIQDEKGRGGVTFLVAMTRLS